MGMGHLTKWHHQVMSWLLKIARDDDVMVATINRSLGRGGATADWTVGQGIASSDDITQNQGTLKKEVG